MAFSKPIFTKLTVAYQHFVEMCTKLHPNQSRNMGIAGGNPFTP
jgi:hypothetical protein